MTNLGRKRIKDKKQSICASFSPYTIKRIDEYLKEESRSLFLEIAANNELDRRIKESI